jgi:hypothetical protein
MRTAFVPKTFVPPQRVDMGEYYLVPITTKETMEDWHVIVDNAETISTVRGAGSRSEWPFTCTLEENYKDLAWLEVCAAYKQLFCYIIRSKKDHHYAGAIYIYPIDLFFPELGEKYDVDFSCWVVKSDFDNGKYDEIFTGLYEWLQKDWPFEKEKIYLRNALLPEKYR